MLDEDIEKIKQLSPKERVRKLKELSEKRKSSLSKIDDLIKSSEQEAKTDSIVENIAPEVAEVNIDSLFEEPTDALEGTVKESAEDVPEGMVYQALKQAYTDYSEIRDIAYASMTGSLTDTQLSSIEEISSRVERQYKNTSQEVANVLVASKAALYQIKKYAGLD